jgi:hypothetical protein
VPVPISDARRIEYGSLRLAGDHHAPGADLLAMTSVVAAAVREERDRSEAGPADPAADGRVGKTPADQIDPVLFRQALRPLKDVLDEQFDDPGIKSVLGTYGHER